MSIVRGPVETYRGTSEGFLGSEGLTGGSGSGVTGAFGDASNFVAVIVNNGSVTAASTFPRAVGSTGVVGDANNYPVLTLTNGEVTAVSTQPRAVGATGLFGDANNYPVVTLANGEVTAVSTQPRQVASGVVAGAYGTAFVVPSFTVDAFGLLTAASSTAVRLPAVVWSASNSVAFGGSANISFVTVAFDTLNCIAETTAGTSMTVSATGAYQLSFYIQLTAAIAASFRIAVNGVALLWSSASTGVHHSISGLLPLNSGDVVTVFTSMASTSAAVPRYLTAQRVA